MRQLILILAISISSANGFAASNSSKERLVTEILKQLKFEDGINTQLSQLEVAIATAMKKNKQPLNVEFLKAKTIGIRAAMVQKYRMYFDTKYTTGELNTLLAFLKTPTGQKYITQQTDPLVKEVYQIPVKVAGELLGAGPEKRSPTQAGEAR